MGSKLFPPKVITKPIERPSKPIPRQKWVSNEESCVIASTPEQIARFYGAVKNMEKDSTHNQRK